jgi:hypothetical protein
MLALAVRQAITQIETFSLQTEKANMKTMVSLAALAVVMGAAQSATAQMNLREIRSVCMSDYHSYCSGVMPGGGRIFACLNEHMPKLSPACAKVVGVAAQCDEDQKKLCPNVPPGNGRTRACLTAHEQQLSPACAAILARAANK